MWQTFLRYETLIMCHNVNRSVLGVITNLSRRLPSLLVYKHLTLPHPSIMAVEPRKQLTARHPCLFSASALNPQSPHIYRPIIRHTEQ